MLKKIRSDKEQKNCYDGFNNLMPIMMVRVAIMIQHLGVDKAFEIFEKRFKGVIPALQTNMFYNAMLYISAKMQVIGIQNN